MLLKSLIITYALYEYCTVYTVQYILSSSHVYKYSTYRYVRVRMQVSP